MVEKIIAGLSMGNFFKEPIIGTNKGALIFQNAYRGCAYNVKNDWIYPSDRTHS